MQETNVPTTTLDVDLADAARAYKAIDPEDVDELVDAFEAIERLQPAIGEELGRLLMLGINTAQERLNALSELAQQQQQ